jgi:UrcA family protein
MKTSLRSALSISALLLTAWSASAHAAPDRSDRLATRTVRVADLDLSTAVGAQTLYERISRAARAVCYESAAMRDMHACRAQLIEDTVKSVGNPLLSSVHRSTAEGVEEVVRR